MIPYTYLVIHKPGEEAISRDAAYSYCYARKVFNFQKLKLELGQKTL